MRCRALVAVLVVATAAMAGGCAVRDRPYRFSSPMLGTAEVPPAPLPGEPPRPRPELANRHRQAEPIRVVSAPRIREASAAAAAHVATAPAARETTRATLSGPHRIPVEVPLPTARAATDLRVLVGRRDPREPLTAVLGWARDLGRMPEGAGVGVTGEQLVAWAREAGRLAEPTELAAPGDLLVFDHVTSDSPADLVAIVIARDDRGVTEFLYLGGDVIRRGFVDASRPKTKRDANLAIVNTFMRHGKRWPAKGSHFLAGELVAHLIRTH